MVLLTIFSAFQSCKPRLPKKKKKEKKGNILGWKSHFQSEKCFLRLQKRSRKK